MASKGSFSKLLAVVFFAEGENIPQDENDIKSIPMNKRRMFCCFQSKVQTKNPDFKRNLDFYLFDIGFLRS